MLIITNMNVRWIKHELTLNDAIYIKVALTATAGAMAIAVLKREHDYV